MRIVRSKLRRRFVEMRKLGDDSYVGNSTLSNQSNGIRALLRFALLALVHSRREIFPRRVWERSRVDLRAVRQWERFQEHERGWHLIRREREVGVSYVSGIGNGPR